MTTNTEHVRVLERMQCVSYGDERAAFTAAIAALSGDTVRGLLEEIEEHLAVGCVPQRGYASRHARIAIAIHKALSAAPQTEGEG